MSVPMAADSGALLHAGRGAARRASSQQCRIVRLQTIVKPCVFSGDAIGQLLHMGFPDDDCARFAQALCNPGICCCGWICLLIIMRPGGGDGPDEIETIFQGNRQSIEKRTICGIREPARKLASLLRTRPELAGKYFFRCCYSPLRPPRSRTPSRRRHRLLSAKIIAATERQRKRGRDFQRSTKVDHPIRAE